MPFKCLLFLFCITLHFTLVGNEKAKQSKVQQDAAEFGLDQSQKLLETIKNFDVGAFISEADIGGEINPETLEQETRKVMKEGGGERETKDFVTGKIPSIGTNQLEEFSIGEFERDLAGILAEESPSDENAFPTFLSKLSIFYEINKDLENSGASDATRTSIFKGECRRCSKSVLENVLYDCCMTMKGGATKIHIAKCSPEEIALSNLREEGKCHFVGSYKKKTLLLTRGERQVFCCFPSKLARIFQEQGRQQLRKGWGTAKNPNCSGLKMQEINKVDFAKIDLQEIMEDQPKSNQEFKLKLESFQNRLQESQNLPEG
ncbi:MAG: hypothetical protein K1000chlam3_00470 [Chlamydiae bacterium]|nr:hypothetical protein [Chlamydiota bacterium]